MKLSLKHNYESHSYPMLYMRYSGGVHVDTPGFMLILHERSHLPRRELTFLSELQSLLELLKHNGWAKLRSGFCHDEK